MAVVVVVSVRASMHAGLQACVRACVRACVQAGWWSIHLPCQKNFRTVCGTGDTACQRARVRPSTRRWRNFDCGRNEMDYDKGDMERTTTDSADGCARRCASEERYPCIACSIANGHCKRMASLSVHKKWQAPSAML